MPLTALSCCPALLPLLLPCPAPPTPHLLQEASSSGEAAQELPAACAQTLLKLYAEQGPEHLQKVVQAVLKK